MSAIPVRFPKVLYSRQGHARMHVEPMLLLTAVSSAAWEGVLYHQWHPGMRALSRTGVPLNTCVAVLMTSLAWQISSSLYSRRKNWPALQHTAHCYPDAILEYWAA